MTPAPRRRIWYNEATKVIPTKATDLVTRVIASRMAKHRVPESGGTVVGTPQNAEQDAVTQERWAELRADSAKCDIDLLQARIYGNQIFKMTLDQFTDVFGRPSKTQDPVVLEEDPPYRVTESLYGTTLYYEERGLRFYFQHPKLDRDQHCRCVIVYLKNAWIKTGGEHTHLSAFKGTITRNIGENWKANRIIQEFTELRPVDLYDPKAIEALRKVWENRPGGDAIFEAMISQYCDINTELKTHRLSFGCESNTRFLERVSICVR